MRSQGPSASNRNIEAPPQQARIGSVVGRDAELQQLGAALADVSRGRALWVLLCGDPGIGKTAILRQFSDSTPGVQAIWGRADEAESSVPFSMLEHAFGANSLWEDAQVTRSAEPSEVGACLVTLLGELERERVVVLLLDDLHWADTASLRALAFAFRRLHSERILAVTAARAAPSATSLACLSRLDEDGKLAVVPMQGLDLIAARQLTIAIGRGDVPDRYLERLVRHTAGNPLHLLSLLTDLPHKPTGSVFELPSPRSMEQIVASRLAACTTDGARLVAAVAVVGGEVRLADAGYVSEIGDPASAADDAIAVGLLERCGGPPDIRIRIPHPLYSSAIYQQLDTVQLLDMHQRAAARLTDEDAVLRHLLAAASAPNAALAERAILHGRGCAATGAWAAAASALTQASQVAADPLISESARLEAAEYCLVVGADQEAEVLLGSTATLPETLGRLLCLRGWLSIQAGDYDAASRILHDAEKAASSQDSLLRGRIANLRAIAEMLAGNGPTAIRLFTEALDLLPLEAAADAKGGLAISLALTGRAEEGLRYLQGQSIGQPAVAMVDQLAAAGQIMLWMDDLNGARTTLREAVRRTRQRAGLPHAYTALGHLAQVEYRSGRWDDAVVYAELAIAAAGEAGLHMGICASHASAVPVPARRGDFETAQRLLKVALHESDRCTDVATTVYAANAAAQFAHSRNDYVSLLAVTECCREVGHLDGPSEPGVFEWQELRLEALVRTGRLAECDADLDRLAGKAESRRRGSTRAGVARVRGLLEAARGNRQAAVAAFDSGAEFLQGLHMPFELAHHSLLFGACLRRFGQRRAAIAQLEIAEETFRTLGAEPHLALVVRELGGCGQTRRALGHQEVTKLTPNEAAVARMVSEGATNKEVAAELIVSAKTVEYHLSNIYRKLGIRSRTELAAKHRRATNTPLLDK